MVFRPGDSIGQCQFINLTIIDDLRLELMESLSVMLLTTDDDAAVVKILQSDTEVQILDNDRK